MVQINIPKACVVQIHIPKARVVQTNLHKARMVPLVGEFETHAWCNLVGVLRN